MKMLLGFFKSIKGEIARSLVAAIFIGATDFGVYFILLRYWPPGLSKAASFVCAGFAAYLFNKHWIFGYSKNQSFGEVVRYIFINGVMLALNVSINQWILFVWPLAVLPALVIASMVTGAVTFVSYKWWVFRVVWRDAAYFAWWKLLPWRLMVTDAARKQGFMDPVKVLSALQKFAQPSEVIAPLELLRSGVVMHVRGLMNSLAIQHNLDWIWPYWVECQYDPQNAAFIPRSFSLTQINLTHRNWTALGTPDGIEFPLVDPRGLVTPHYDGWSLDFWIIPEQGEPLIPSRLTIGRAQSMTGSQKLLLDDGYCVVTVSNRHHMKLQTKVEVIGSAEVSFCQVKVMGVSALNARLVVSLRPYNPEGISLIHKIAFLDKGSGWYVNGEKTISIDKAPEHWAFSDYERGDVFSRLLSESSDKEVVCSVGMASAAAIYELKPALAREIIVSIPFTEKLPEKNAYVGYQSTASFVWKKSLQGACVLQIPDEHFQFLYDAAIHTMILHSPKEVYPGPYIYRRFWFRDAAYILNAMLCVGLKGRVKRALDCFRARQTAQGYFLSQEGEWDSNGEALWIMRQYCEMTGNMPAQEWKNSIYKAGQWICKKRLPDNLVSAYAGLLPSGFSAEHLGPNDFYYWDDFWGVAGLNAAAFLCGAYQDHGMGEYFKTQSGSLQHSINQSLTRVQQRLGKRVMPASPYRRMDSGAIGSLVAGYPLRIIAQDDPALLDTAEYLMGHCLVHGGFFHDMTHSGINPYLTLHLAQVLLRAGDSRYFSLMTAVAQLASSTGQWPESVHPRTGGGCMGDGQHVWAAAEWVLMIRNCFVREEHDCLILCSGIPRVWLDKGQSISFGLAPTSFGDVQIYVKPQGSSIRVEWHGQWFAQEPVIDIRLPGFKSVRVLPGTNFIDLKEKVS